MTVSSQTLAFEYAANGVTTTFPYGFRVLDAAQVKVYVNDVIQVGGYSLTGVGDAGGGNVVFSVAPVNGATVLVRRISDRVRTTDFQQAPYFTQEELLDRDQDYQTMLLQEAAADGDNSLKIPAAETLETVLPAAELRANKAIVFDELGNVTVSEDDYEDQVAAVAASAAAALASENAAEAAALAASNSESAADASEAAAAASAAAAAASANAAAGTYYVATKAAGDTLAASLADGAAVIVTADESQGGVRVRYTVASGALTSGVLDTASQIQATGGVTVQEKLDEITSLEADIFSEKIRNGYALREWRGVAAYSDRAACKIMTLSDSIFEGYNMTAVIGTPLTDDLPMRRLHSLLLSKYSLTGRAAQYYPTQPGLTLMSVTPPADWPVVVSGGTAVGNSFGLGARSRLMSGTNTVTFNFTSLANNATLRFYYLKFSGGGTLRWTLDGGANAAVSTSAATLADMKSTDVPIATAGAHSIVITIDSGSVYFCGFMLLENADVTSGIWLYEGGHAGAPSNLFTDTSGGSGNYIDDWFTELAPNLLILELGANDYTGKNPPNSVATFKANLKTIIDTYQATGSQPKSILIVSVWKLNPTFTPIAAWDEYRQAMIDLADEEGAGFLDASLIVRKDSESTALNPGFMLSDSTHLSVGGAKVIADYLADIL